MPPPPSDPDIGRVLRLVEAQGYAVPEHAAGQRFVSPPDRAGRNELLILYAEPFGDGEPDTMAYSEGTGNDEPHAPLSTQPFAIVRSCFVLLATHRRDRRLFAALPMVSHAGRFVR